MPDYPLCDCGHLICLVRIPLLLDYSQGVGLALLRENARRHHQRKGFVVSRPSARVVSDGTSLGTGENPLVGEDLAWVGDIVFCAEHDRPDLVRGVDGLESVARTLPGHQQSDKQNERADLYGRCRQETPRREVKKTRQIGLRQPIYGTQKGEPLIRL